MNDLISRQAAIDALCSECQGRCVPCGSYPCNDIKAINNLPSAQPEPCEDAVSRRRLLSDLKELTAAWGKYPVMAEQIKGVETAIGYVETIPSVTPERERGKWKMALTKDLIGFNTVCFRCSECNGMEYSTSPFCRMCGAKMEEGEQDETD